MRFIDVEQAMNTGFAAMLGVDLDNLAFVQPQSGEQALDIMIFAGRIGTLLPDCSRFSRRFASGG